MAVRPRYKQTDVGNIPEEWEVVAVKQLVEQAVLEKPLDGNHGNIHPKSSDYVQDGIPFVMANNFSKGEVNLESCKFITKNRADRLQKGFSVTGDVLLTHKGTVGSTAIVGELSSEYIMLTPQVTYYRVKDANRLNNRFLRHYFDSPRFQALFASLAGGGTRAYLGIVKQLDLPIVKPSIDEQRAIAATLSDMDALLGGLDRLIDKKRHLKQAAMQQLLTGQTHLPGFHGKWQVRRLGEMAAVVSGGTPRTTEQSYWNGGIKWCTPTDITRDVGKYLTETERTISRDGLNNSGATLLPVGALLLCSRATIGEVKIASVPMCTNQGFKSLVCRPEVSNEFLYYKLLTMKQQLVERAFGSTFLEISTHNVSSLEFATPPHDEQTAIAAVLSDMDAELLALDALRGKTRGLKEAMIQELLTGRTRLVPEGVADA
jgi:type I restriction enzyme S subunit